jgi:mRNA interferase RelE/StbE
MPYRLQIERRAEKDLDRLGGRTLRRMLEGIRDLAHRPRPPGCAKLAGASDLWRIRIGDYRVIYAIDDDSRWVHVMYVRHRKDAYRRA